MSQPNKRQKLDLEGIDPLRNVDSAAPSSAATYHVPSLQEASLVEAAPEQSGNSEGDLTEAALVLRRKEHVQQLCSVYQAQLQGVLESTRHTQDGKTKAVAAEVILSSNVQTLPNLTTTLPFISRSEQVSAAATCRDLDAKRSLALLCGKQTRYIISYTAVDLGRCTSTKGKVDIDLADEGDARKVSRKQAHLRLCANGKFTLANTGRQTISVNGVELVQHACISLEHLSLIDMAGIRLLFMINQSAVRRLVTRSQNLVL